MNVRFEVTGQPYPKQRPRFDSRSRRPHGFTPERTRAWEQLVALSAYSYMNQEGLTPFTGPVFVRLHFRRGGNRHADLDNLCKAVLDAINGLVFNDDRQVEALTITVVKGSDRPGVEVIVESP